MKIVDYFSEQTTFLKQNLSSKEEVFDLLATNLVDKKHKDLLIKDLMNREQQGPTGVGMGIAIPHCASKAIKHPQISILTTKNKISWESLDNQPVDVIFVITTPSGRGGDDHLQALSKLASYLMDEKLVNDVRNAQSYQEIINIFNNKDLMVEQENSKKSQQSSQGPEVVAITACPTGIAHTYMAKEKIEEAAQALGYSYKVETQGRSGNENVLTEQDIANAKVIILAADKALTGLERFNGKQVIQVGTKDAIYDSKKLINDYLNKTTKFVTINQKASKNDEVGELTLDNFRHVTRNLLGGVSRMLPFVVAGGIILGIGFLLDSGNSGSDFGTIRPIAAWFSGLGKVIFGLMIPVLGAYICYSIVGPQGLMPGMVCGLIATAPSMLYGTKLEGFDNTWGRIFPAGLKYESGFFGAIAGAYLSAFVIYGLSVWWRRMPKSMRGVRDIVFIPVISALAAGLIMFAINIPLGYLNHGLGLGLKALADYKLGALAGLIIGLMMAADMGGPINKAAYVFGTLTIDGNNTVYKQIQSSNGGTVFMASAMIAGMVPPLALALSTRLFKSVWSKRDIEGGNSNWFLSACFITEGAIPYAASDPRRVIPSIMVGSGLTGAIISGFGVTVSAPHGGVFVFPLLRIQDNGSNWFSLNNWGLSLAIALIITIVALFLGALLSAFILGYWRKKDLKNGKLIIKD